MRRRFQPLLWVAIVAVSTAVAACSSRSSTPGAMPGVVGFPASSSHTEVKRDLYSSANCVSPYRNQTPPPGTGGCTTSQGRINYLLWQSMGGKAFNIGLDPMTKVPNGVDLQITTQLYSPAILTPITSICAPPYSCALVLVITVPPAPGCPWVTFPVGIDYYESGQPKILFDANVEVNSCSGEGGPVPDLQIIQSKPSPVSSWVVSSPGPSPSAEIGTPVYLN